MYTCVCIYFAKRGREPAAHTKYDTNPPNSR